VEEVVDFPVWRISTVVLSVWPELTSLLASQIKDTIGSATLQSRRFKAEFVERRNLLPELVAAPTYNINTGELDYDPAIFDPESIIGKRDVALPLPKKPSFQEAFRDNILFDPFSFGWYLMPSPKQTSAGIRFFKITG
jgi:hypothetical protein